MSLLLSFVHNYCCYFISESYSASKWARAQSHSASDIRNDILKQSKRTTLIWTNWNCFAFFLPNFPSPHTSISHFIVLADAILPCFFHLSLRLRSLALSLLLLPGKYLFRESGWVRPHTNTTHTAGRRGRYPLKAVLKSTPADKTLSGQSRHQNKQPPPRHVVVLRRLSAYINTASRYESPNHPPDVQYVGRIILSAGQSDPLCSVVAKWLLSPEYIYSMCDRRLSAFPRLDRQLSSILSAAVI